MRDCFKKKGSEGAGSHLQFCCPFNGLILDLDRVVESHLLSNAPLTLTCEMMFQYNPNEIRDAHNGSELTQAQPCEAHFA